MKCNHGLDIEEDCEDCTKLFSQIKDCPYCGDGIPDSGMKEHVERCKPMIEKNKTIKRKYVLKEWLSELPLVMQATLLTGIRGSDQTRDDKTKSVVRWIRRQVINNGRSGGKFVNEDPLPDIKEFGQSIEYMNFHFVSHLSHALQIISYKHPSTDIRNIACMYYIRLCEKLHCKPESEEHMDKRLVDDDFVTTSVYQ